MHVNYLAFAPIPAGATSRRLYIDAEARPDGEAWELVIRGEDYQVAGRTLTDRVPQLIHNQPDGSYVRYVLATGGRAEIERAADSLMKLYRSSAPLGARLQGIGAELMPLVAVLFAAFPPDLYGKYDGKAARTGRFSNTRAGRRCAPLQTI